MSATFQGSSVREGADVQGPRAAKRLSHAVRAPVGRSSAPPVRSEGMPERSKWNRVGQQHMHQGPPVRNAAAPTSTDQVAAPGRPLRSDCCRPNARPSMSASLHAACGVQQRPRIRPAVKGGAQLPGGGPAASPNTSRGTRSRARGPPKATWCGAPGGDRGPRGGGTRAARATPLAKLGRPASTLR